MTDGRSPPKWGENPFWVSSTFHGRRRRKNCSPFFTTRKNLLNVNDERAERERETFFFFFLGTRPTSSLLQVDVYREITHTHTHTLLFYYDCTTSRYSPRGGRKTGPCVCCVCVRKRRKVGLDARRRKQKPPGVAQRKKKQKTSSGSFFCSFLVCA